MSTVHYIVRIDNKNKTYDTSLIMKTELENEIDTKIKELKQKQNSYFVHITKTNDTYDGNIILAHPASTATAASAPAAPALAAIASNSNNYSYLKIIDTSKEENLISKANVLQYKFKNYILIDPAGDAFLNNTTFTGGGLSGAIYNAFNLSGLSHTINLKHTEATLLKRDNVLSDEKEAPVDSLIESKYIRGIIHAIGPDKRISNYENDENFYKALETTMESIITVIIDNKLNSNDAIILLPMISAGIYGGNISTDTAKFKAYLTKYIKMIETLHLITTLPIYLMYYSNNNPENEVPKFLKEICNMLINNVDLSDINIDAELAILESQINANIN